jgi:hypothetical protein
MACTVEQIMPVRGMTTDKQMHLIFKACPKFLFELADLPYPGPCKVQSVEVKSLARTADAVITPRNPMKPLVVAEIQAQKEGTVYNRLAMEMAQLQMDYKGRDITGLILFGRRSYDPKTQPWASFIRAVYLDEALVRLKTKNPDHPLVAAFSPMFTRQESVLEKTAEHQYKLIKQSKLGKSAGEILEQVFFHWLCERLKNRTPEEIAMILNLPDISQTRVGKEFLARGIKQGIEQGIEQGMERGREAALIESIIRVGTKQFGPAPAGIKKNLEKLSQKHLSEGLGLVLDAVDWKSVTLWVKART